MLNDFPEAAAEFNRRILSVLLFGSRAEGATSESDVDF
jgi:predicted nucleotidyltransferase